MEQANSVELDRPPFHTIKEVAAITGRCYKTIHEATRAGKIRTIRFGGFVAIPAAELRRICEEGYQ